MSLPTLARDQHLALLTLDDGKANAFTFTMINAFHRALDEVDADPTLRALVISGREGRFSGGFDLAVIKAGGEGVRKLIGAGAELALRLYEYSRPVVMVCTGHALAMGAITLLSADWRTGCHGAYKIGMNETAIGMTMPEFAAELARDRLNPAYYTRAVAGAEIYSPEDALAAGYLDELVDPLSALDFACVQADRLSKLDLRAFVRTRLQTRRPTISRIRAGLVADLAGLGTD